MLCGHPQVWSWDLQFLFFFWFVVQDSGWPKETMTTCSCFCLLFVFGSRELITGQKKPCCAFQTQESPFVPAGLSKVVHHGEWRHVGCLNLSPEVAKSTFSKQKKACKGDRPPGQARPVVISEGPYHHNRTSHREWIKTVDTEMLGFSAVLHLGAWPPLNGSIFY